MQAIHLFMRQHQNQGRIPAVGACLFDPPIGQMYHQNPLLDLQHLPKWLFCLPCQILKHSGHISHYPPSFLHGPAGLMPFPRCWDQLAQSQIRNLGGGKWKSVQPSWPLCLDAGTVSVLIDSYLDVQVSGKVTIKRQSQRFRTY